MKAPAFSYARPTRLADVLTLLEKHGDEARLLAGGQTLLATLNMRLSEPALLIDMQSVQELKGLSVAKDFDRMSVAVFDANRDVYLKHFGASAFARGKWRAMFGLWKRVARLRARLRGHRAVRPV